jgi:hypothetical protein
MTVESRMFDVVSTAMAEHYRQTGKQVEISCYYAAPDDGHRMDLLFEAIRNYVRCGPD